MLEHPAAEAPCFVVVDLETTGLDPALEAIVEVAAVRITPSGEVLGRYGSLVRPHVPVSPASGKIHGLGEEELADAPKLSEVLPQLLSFCGQDPLVAHHAAFDVAFISRAMRAYGLPALTNPVIDTLEWARELVPEQRSHKLEALCIAFGVPASGFHRAMADAEALGGVFPELLRRYRLRLSHLLAQHERIDAVALRYAELTAEVEARQAELGELRRVLGHYFHHHPNVVVPLPSGGRLRQVSKAVQEYDAEALAPLLNTWGLSDRFWKLDRQRLERWLAGDRLSEAQKAAVAAAKLPSGVQVRYVLEQDNGQGGTGPLSLRRAGATGPLNLNPLGGTGPLPPGPGGTGLLE